MHDFPTQCLPEPGCSRVARDFNHRANYVDPKDIITISGLNVENIHNTLKGCIQNEQIGTIIADEVPQSAPNNRLLHSIFVSNFFGFIDDMYLQIVD
mmetsp:Transcript_12092/g.12092  ORF Transcript_12092/g.12092 Transcript_12092/m.12092 type:complete len:97 (+) Transcript_12092:341-631(+)